MFYYLVIRTITRPFRSLKYLSDWNYILSNFDSYEIILLQYFYNYFFLEQ